ncbi:hypothetical protein HaLaN_29109 [Haematococcus lacustris]|uniref:Uncharacterized protein n=1 Tax=Haematococcus lacustris TaxID=44745 RepID=A0A6A0AEJ4_HAELA|nr:hypothetical protein HaLaN_29109 [Haematococcus lacustris]
MLQKLELEHELLGVWGTTTTPGLEVAEGAHSPQALAQVVSYSLLVGLHCSYG